MGVLVVAELNQSKVSVLTHSAITAALALKAGDVDVIVVGETESGEIEELASMDGIRCIFHDESQVDLTAEYMTQVIREVVSSYSHLVAASSTFAKNWLPRLAGVLGCYAMTDVVEIIDANHFVRPIYAGNALEHLELDQAFIPMTIRPTVFEPISKGNSSAKLEKLSPCQAPLINVKVVQKVNQQSDKPDLTNAKVVVSGGRGVGSADGFTMIEELAVLLSAAVGASRAAVDAEYVSNDYQVGQTGKIIAPDLYIAIGISGAIQHLAGMKDSKVIIAINRDEDAPIFKVADYGLVADLHQVLPELVEKIRQA